MYPLILFFFFGIFLASRFFYATWDFCCVVASLKKGVDGDLLSSDVVNPELSELEPRIWLCCGNNFSEHGRLYYCFGREFRQYLASKFVCPLLATPLPLPSTCSFNQNLVMGFSWKNKVGDDQVERESISSTTVLEHSLHNLESTCWLSVLKIWSWVSTSTAFKLPRTFKVWYFLPSSLQQHYLHHNNQGLIQ